MDPTPPSPDNATPPPQLDAVEARILGCLIEKAAITPEVYPLTVNAVVSAANQKTSREPVMHLETGAVAHALRGLEDRGLVKVAPASQRALRYEHRFDSIYGVTARQRAVLCIMMLRGPQTVNELLTRTDRLVDFPGADDVRDTLDRLMQRDAPYVVCLGRVSGQREDRYMHLLSGPVDAEAYAASAASSRASAPHDDGRDARIAALEEEVASLRAAVEALQARVGGAEDGP